LNLSARNLRRGEVYMIALQRTRLAVVSALFLFGYMGVMPSWADTTSEISPIIAPCDSFDQLQVPLRLAGDTIANPA
jgi:hypothetical protein